VPAAPASKGIELRSKHNIAYICTFSDDEPYRQVIESAKYLPKDVTIYITGNSNKLNPEIKQMTPENIVFTGFISEREYWELLSSVDVIIALTDRQNCLLCGAYEAVAVGKPIILTSTTALKQFFHKGCVYTLNDERSISRGILNALSNIQTLLDDISALKDELDNSWLLKASEFQKRLN
jgi:glycosyltransferase involved in cell wall biosynthesis